MKNPNISFDNYDPEVYWSTRALNNQDDYLNAVCVESATNIENKSMDRVQRHVVKKALNHIGLKKASVLEYGCGAGRWVDFFQNQGFDWKGVDISSDMLKRARERRKNAEVKKVENNCIPYPDQSFGLVYSVTVVHHNPYEQQEKIISEMARVLQDNGYLIMLESTNERTRRFARMFPRPLEDWNLLVKKFGFVPKWHYPVSYLVLRKRLLSFTKSIKNAEDLKSTPSTHIVKSSSTKTNSKSVFSRNVIGTFDFILAPYLIHLLPEERRDGAIMVFKKYTN